MGKIYPTGLTQNSHGSSISCADIYGGCEGDQTVAMPIMYLIIGEEKTGEITEVKHWCKKRNTDHLQRDYNNIIHTYLVV